jgi:hypothetical protein
MPEQKLERVEVAPGQYLSLNERDRKAFEAQQAAKEPPYIQTPGALSSGARELMEQEEASKAQDEAEAESKAAERPVENKAQAAPAEKKSR